MSLPNFFPEQFRRQSPDAVFQDLTHIIADGEPIVLLIGDELSFESGLPSSSQTAHFLAVTSHLIRRHNSLRSINRQRTLTYAEHISALGWPGPFNVHDDLLEIETRLKYIRRQRRTGKDEYAVGESIPRLRDLLETALRDSIHETLLDTSPFLGDNLEYLESRLSHFVLDWRTFLLKLTEGDSTLISSFVDRFFAGYQPGLGHHYIAAMTKALGWPLLLSTTCDTLLEDGLRLHGLNPQLLQLPGHGEQFPPTSLIRGKLSLLRITSPLRLPPTSVRSEVPFTKEQCERFLEYIPPRAHLLVLGYRENDHRTLSLISSSMRDRQHKLIWTTRNVNLIPTHISHKTSAAAAPVIVEYSSATKFLQELYVRLFSTHPPLKSSYRALQQFPPLPSRRDQLHGAEAGGESDTAHQAAAHFIIFHSTRPGTGTSTRLSKFCQKHESSHRIIWIDMEEVPNVDSLASRLFDEFRIDDLEMHPSLIERIARRSDAAEILNRPDSRVSRIVQALRHGRYLLAIDSIAEFGRDPLAHDASTPMSDIRQKLNELYAFILDLAAHTKEFGSSYVAIAISPPKVAQGPSRDAGFIQKRLQTTFDVNAPTLIHQARIPSSSKVVSPSSLKESLPNISRQETDLPIVGKYEIERLCGSGGFSNVYKAFDPILQRKVAIKVPRSDKLLSEAEGNMFLREARVLARLRHPSIVAVYDAVPSDRGIAVVSQYIDGGTLAEQMNSGGPSEFTYGDTARVLVAIADALEYAHREGVLHRDIKPTNILFDHNDNPAICDFGFATLFDDLSRFDTIAGTPDYMSPEQTGRLRGITDLDARSDIYSLGVVMFQLITGELPFHGTWQDIIDAKLYKDAPDPRSINAELDEALASICSRAIARRPENRYPTAQDFANDLLAWVEHQFVIPNSHPTKEKTPFVEPAVLRELRCQFVDLLDHLRSMAPNVFLKPVEGPVQYSSIVEQDAIRGLLTNRSNAAEIIRKIKGEHNTHLSAIKVLWDQLALDCKKLLVVAGMFRRPRSLVALRRLGLCATRYPNESVNVFMELLSSARVEELFDSASADDLNNVDQILARLCDAHLLVRQEGGWYWMHSDIRDCIFQLSYRETAIGVSNLNDVIAGFYYDEVFDASGDITALVESVYHRVHSIYHSAPYDRAFRLRNLLGLLQSERHHLVSAGAEHGIIEWLVVLRVDALAHIERTIASLVERQGNTRIYRDMAATIRTLRNIICNMEAVTRRKATNYSGCMSVRLRQIADRMEDLSECDAFEGINLKQFMEGWNGWLDAELYDETARSVCNVIRCIASKEDVVSRERFGGVVKDVFHFAVDVAVCLQGLRISDAASNLLETVEGEAGNLGRWAFGQSDAVPLREWILSVRGDCIFREMSGYLNQIDIWCARIEQREALLRKARIAYERGELLVKECDTKRVAVLKLQLMILRSQWCYLEGKFEQARRLLNVAQALLDGNAKRDEDVTVAICELHLAESLMLEADNSARRNDRIRRTAESSLTGSSSLLRDATTKIQLADESIRRARSVMVHRRGHISRWQNLHQLEAQLCHEQFLLSCCEKYSDQDRQLRLVRRGLHAVAAGLDLVDKDHVRRERFRVLWWQYFLCLAYVQQAVELVELWPQWLDMNRLCGLEWLAEHEENRHLEIYGLRWHDVISSLATLGGDYPTRDTVLSIENDVITGRRKIVSDANCVTAALSEPNPNIVP